MGRIELHNREVKATAEHRAWEMKMYPSKLEERMQHILEDHDIYYEPQRIFYIYADDDWIIRYYIADFFIPEANVIIEVDGKFHDKQKQHDKNRTKTIQEQYPDVRVLRYSWKDTFDEDTMEEMVYTIKNLCN